MASLSHRARTGQDQITIGQSARLAAVLYLGLCLGGIVRGASDERPATSDANDPFPQVLRAMIQVESGGDPEAIGDGGRAIGVLQIHRAYWIDAMKALGRDWPYEDAKDPVKAVAACRAYCWRYARHYNRPWTAETIARIHNGGPRGWDKPATIRYYRKVQAAIGQ